MRLKKLNKGRFIVLILVVGIILVLFKMYYFSVPVAVLYRFKDRTESHCYIIYNVDSADKLKEVSNTLYCNILFDTKVNVIRTSSNVSEKSLPFGFSNVDTDNIIVGYSEFNENGVFYLRDTLIKRMNNKPIGIFSFYIGKQVNEELERRHFEIYDSLLNEVGVVSTR